MRSIRRFASLNSDDRALLLSAALLLTFSRLCLWILPWRSTIRTLRWLPVPRKARFSPRQAAWAVDCASRVIPGIACLTQALALHHMLSRAGHDSRIQLGVANRTGRFEAHAWVEHGNEPLLNSASELRRYARLATLEGR